ncbi:Ferredoxin-1 [Streptomyces sp. enrichment culture]
MGWRAPGDNSEGMSIHIDHTRCVGAGQCALTAPRVFTQDDDGYSALLPGHDPGDPMVREAARACPVRAIGVREP